MTHPPAHGDADSSRYEIRVQGQLDRHWSDWFGGLTVAIHGDGTSTLTGPVVDQAALQGLLRRIGDLGVTLISLNVTNETEEEDRDLSTE